MPHSVDRRPSRFWLGPAAVAAGFVIAQVILVIPGLGMGWDETVYASQVDPRSPTAFFSAPRARGITYLIAPVTVLTPSLLALRIWLALLSGIGLLLALRVWRRLLPAPVLTVAGALFASLWITVFYGPQAMPNLWVALGCLAAVGYFLRSGAVRTGTSRVGTVRLEALPLRRVDPDRHALLGLGASVTAVGLMRPTDAAWLVLPLGLVALVGRVRPAVLAVLACGLALGWAEWLIEAWARYGGPRSRLHRASEVQGGMGWNWAVDDQARSLDGRGLCRPCDVPWPHPSVTAWWFLLPLLVLAGLWVARRAGRGRLVGTATLTGGALAVPYLFLIGYAAPRFLLPTYALLAVPTAECLLRLTASARHRRQVLAALAAVLSAHLAVQYAVLAKTTQRSDAARRDVKRVAEELHRQGVRPPCVVSGHQAVQIAYQAGCASRQTRGNDTSITPRALVGLSASRPVAVVVVGRRPPPSFARDWRRQALPDLGSTRGVRAYLSPSAVPGPTSGG
ncbi:hypothetical protein [Wenjunlia vitaminophila]|uniref:hypothetical protein n=1 Tax=Wenjunlia vitaminophila TaxID=76728 RepID=UPI00037BF779